MLTFNPGVIRVEYQHSRQCPFAHIPLPPLAIATMAYWQPQADQAIARTWQGEQMRFRQIRYRGVAPIPRRQQLYRFAYIKSPP